MKEYRSAQPVQWYTLHPRFILPRSRADAELLHLRQPIRGFLLVRSLALDPFHHQETAYIDEALAKTVNVLDHDIFVSDFVESGLSIAEFVSSNEAVAPSHRNLSKRWTLDLGSGQPRGWNGYRGTSGLCTAKAF